VGWAKQLIISDRTHLFEQFHGSTKEQGYRVLADNFSLGRIPQEAHRPQQEQAHQAEELVGEFS